MASLDLDMSWGDNAPRHIKSDPKPAKRHKASSSEWETIRRYFTASCCVSCGLPHQHLHHIAFRSEGGGDVVENLAPMCLTCHERFHKRSDGWDRVAAAVRQYVMVDNHRRQYAENVLRERFNTRYPCLPNTDPQFQDDFRRIYRLGD